jgi:hypothetical protein
MRRIADNREIRRTVRKSPRVDELLSLLAYHSAPERVTSERMRGFIARPETDSGHNVTVDGPIASTSTMNLSSYHI